MPFAEAGQRVGARSKRRGRGGVGGDGLCVLFIENFQHRFAAIFDFGSGKIEKKYFIDKLTSILLYIKYSYTLFFIVTHHKYIFKNSDTDKITIGSIS